MNLSFVIPCYRSEHTIIPVLEEIRNKMIEQLFCTIMQISILS